MTWPSTEDFYLEHAGVGVRPSRPLHQGDVFVDVPFTVANPKRPEGSYFPERLATVQLVGHPCSIRAGHSILPVQAVVEVRLKRDIVQPDHPFEEPYESHFHLFPLPDLIEGDDYVADFRRVGTVVTKELIPQRVACLDKEAWVGLQRRLVYHTTRHELDFDLMLARADEWWNEVELWEEWNSRGLPEDDFDDWLSEPVTSGSYSGTTRRDVAAFAPDHVRAELPQPPEEPKP